MAAKRFFDGDHDQPNQKRIKTRPSFASVIREVVMVNFFENFCSALEPMLRRVVSEEVENGLRRRCMGMGSLQNSPSLKMIEQAPPSSATSRLRLAFLKKLSLPIFTGTKIVDTEGSSLQIVLLDHDKVPTSLSHPIKLEIVVVDGEFPSHKDEWSAADLAKNLVKERSGKRPLLAGELNMTMRDGVCSVGDVEFTDNSSWIRSRKFRLAVRVVAQHAGAQPLLIQEALTEPFVVKDHRGELYKKHYPPALDDDVWRLEKIGKGGAFHQKLSSQGINTVQDFLKLYVVDSPKLKWILGIGMSERMWDATVKHAKSCVLGSKVYQCQGSNFTLLFNPICQLIKAEFNGQVYHQRHFKTMQTTYFESLVRDAYARWNSLEELEGMPLLTQGEVVEQQQLAGASSYLSDGSDSVMQNYSDNNNNTNSININDDWGIMYNTNTNTDGCTPKTGFTTFFSDHSSSDGDIS